MKNNTNVTLQCLPIDYCFECYENHEARDDITINSQVCDTNNFAFMDDYELISGQRGRVMSRSADITA